MFHAHRLDRLLNRAVALRLASTVLAVLALLFATTPTVQADPSENPAEASPNFPADWWTDGQTRAFEVLQQGVSVGIIHTRLQLDYGTYAQQIDAANHEIAELDALTAELAAEANENARRTAATREEIRSLEKENTQLLQDPVANHERITANATRIAEQNDVIAKLARKQDKLATEIAVLAERRAELVTRRDALIAKSNPARVLVTKTEMGMEGQRGRGQSVATFRADGTPSHYTLIVQGTTLEYEFGDTAITVNAPGGQQVIPNMARLAMLENNNIVMLELIIASADWPEVGKSASLPFRNPMNLQSVQYTFKVAAVDETGTSTLTDNLGEEITWTDGVGITRVELPAAEVVFASSDAEYPSWDLRNVEPLEYTLPANAPFDALEVVVERKTYEGQGKGGFKLAGTLNIPHASVHGEGPYPAVFLQSGSGSQDRHGFAGDIDAGSWETLDAIAEAGFVVLRVDDRGTGASELGAPGQDLRKIGAHELLGDCRSCVDFLMARPEVDPSRVFVLGHSEGGLIIAMLAALPEVKLAGIVSLAGVGRNFGEVIIDQVRDAQQALPPAEREAAMRAQRELMAAVRDNREPDFSILDPTAWEESKRMHYWMRSHLLLDVPAIHHAIDEPALLLQGVEDIQVNYIRDARTYAKGLIDGGNLDVTLRTFPDLDHLFKPCGGQPSTLEMYEDRTRRVDPMMLKVLVNWLELHAGN